MNVKFLAKFISILCVTLSYADVRLPSVISDNMVLQQNSEVNIWGWAKPKEKIYLKASWQQVFGKSVRADNNGNWKITLRTPKAGGPHKITIKAGNTVNLENILTGEVWIASGQSNMEMPLKPVSKAYTGVSNFEEEIANADYPEIRLFQVGNYASIEPLDEVEPGIEVYNIPKAECKWQQCSPKTVANFSSTAYFFARKLHKELGVPVGIIDSSWGGTMAESWTPAEGLEKLGYHEQLKHYALTPQNPDQKNIPIRLYNGMIHPLRNLTIKGVVWYQGESNISQSDKYCRLFSTMIEQWRGAFGQDFPFYFVQISPFNYDANQNSAFLREAQLKTMISVPKTGMAVTMDIGNLTDIHPKNKQEVGRRLGLWALANDYGRTELVFSGPIYKSMQVEKNTIRLWFNHIGSGLIARDGELTNFTIAGNDKVFVDATAKIENDTVVVFSEKVLNPVAVRFAFSNTAMPNLFNKEGLPASPFRSDDW
jgi:sialate O-acetylesterase